MRIIGIDLGTTNSLAAVWLDGQIQLIPDSSGSVMVPSAVSLSDSGEVLVGEAAKECLISCPERSAGGFKREMGKNTAFYLGHQKFLPEELSALVLRRLRENAERFLGEPVEEAVISVPAYFTADQRAATRRAGLLAGLKVERLINEPSAAALALRGEATDDCSYLVFDFGGGTLDISVVECFEEIVNILAICGDTRLGGRDFDLAIARLYCEKNNLDFAGLSPLQRQILLRQAELCKIGLSNAPISAMQFHSPGLEGFLSLTGQELISCCKPFLKKIEDLLHRALRDSGLTAAEMPMLLPVGGSCQMPVIIQYLQYLLRCPLAPVPDPETVVARGVGMYAAMKEKPVGLRRQILTDLCPFSLGIAVENSANPNRPYFSPIIERNSALPTSKVGHYSTAQDNQKRIEVEIYQGEQPYAADNLKLGSLSCSIPPAPAGYALDVRFTYDINGILEVEAVQTKTGQTIRTVFNSSGMADDELALRLTWLQQLKRHPREDEENIRLCARAQRMFALSQGRLRKEIATRLNLFEQALRTQEPRIIHRARATFSKALDQIQVALDAGDENLFFLHT